MIFLTKMVPFFKPILIWQLAKYGFQHYLAGIIGHLHVYLTNLLSALYLLPAQVAFFSMAKRLGEQITCMIPGAINTLLFPKRLFIIYDNKYGIKSLCLIFIYRVITYQ